MVLCPVGSLQLSLPWLHCPMALWEGGRGHPCILADMEERRDEAPTVASRTYGGGEGGGCVKEKEAGGAKGRLFFSM